MLLRDFSNRGRTNAPFLPSKRRGSRIVVEMDNEEALRLYDYLAGWGSRVSCTNCAGRTGRVLRLFFFNSLGLEMRALVNSISLVTW